METALNARLRPVRPEQDGDRDHRGQHSVPVRRGVRGENLTAKSDVETRNRKPLQRPVSIGADWELRLGPNNRFRVFYRIASPDHEIYVLAIGIKDGNHLLIGGEEFQL